MNFSKFIEKNILLTSMLLTIILMAIFYQKYYYLLAVPIIISLSYIKKKYPDNVVYIDDIRNFSNIG